MLVYVRSTLTGLSPPCLIWIEGISNGSSGIILMFRLPSKKVQFPLFSWAQRNGYIVSIKMYEFRHLFRICTFTIDFHGFICWLDNTLGITFVTSWNVRCCELKENFYWWSKRNGMITSKWRNERMIFNVIPSRNKQII